MFALHFCTLCSSPCRHIDLCTTCKHKLPWVTHQFLSAPANIESRFALFLLDDVVRTWIHAFKYTQQLPKGQLFAELMVHHFILPIDIQCVMPIPLHSHKLRQRGYNQSHCISRLVSKQLGRAHSDKLLIRHRNTPSQTGLKLKQRYANVKQAFSVTAPTIPDNILLIDDVFTTGATVQNAVDALKQVNPDVSVHLWTIATVK